MVLEKQFGHRGDGRVSGSSAEFFLVASLTGVMAVASRAGQFALTVVAGILGFVHVYAAVIWAIGAFVFAHYKLNCVAALVLAVGLAALAVMDFDCGPAGHAKCYEKCITFPGGHYLLAFVPIFFAYTVLGMSHTDPPQRAHVARGVPDLPAL